MDDKTCFIRPGNKLFNQLITAYKYSNTNKICIYLKF